jgi:hypothetical protein
MTFLDALATSCLDRISLLQPMSMVLPGVVGFKLAGKLKNGVTATDLVLTVTQILRKHGVVGKFVEFYGNHIIFFFWGFHSLWFHLHKEFHSFPFFLRVSFD